ncbi:TRAP transporter small permease [Halalkalibacter urbisdiaboli]|uniref:TRAP transporter small permease n=1 Tax=Halalkalibacter urbisdiaboli TaxID=1960589 RepID=UPI000B43CB52|nr:TRAP transporter small permease [Halalkalibacter urbisdiaboli]
MTVLKWLDEHIEEVFLVMFSAVMVVVIFLQVFMRYVMGNSLSWSEELARYCFIWLVYIGISYGVKKQRHIKVDALLLLFKEKGKLVFNMIANLLFLSFAMFIVIYGYDMAERLLQFGQTSPALRIPMGFVYLAAPVGMALTSIRLIQNLLNQVKTLLGKGNFEVKTEFDRLVDEEG